MSAILGTEIGQVAARVETTKGTALAPTAVHGGIEVWDPQVTPVVGVAARPPAPAPFGTPAGIPNVRHYEATFRCPLKGRASAGIAPDIMTLLRGCGLSETIVASTSTTYQGVSVLSSQETITLDVYRDGKRWRLTGAVGNLVAEVRRDAVPYVDFSFLGKYVAPTDTAILVSPPYVATSPPQPVGATLTLLSQTLIATGWTFNLGNELKLRQDITDATGWGHGYIANRDSVISIDPEDELVATFDFLQRLTNGTLGEFVGQIGTVAGNIIRLRAPAVQVTDAPYAEREGLLTRNVSLRCRENVVDSNDQFTLRYT